ncbi:aminopyruvatide family RiPP [Kitasatospora sp. NPDC004531]
MSQKNGGEPSSARGPTVRGVAAEHRIELRSPKVELGFELTDEKKEAIAACLRNGNLKMTAHNASIDILGGNIRAEDGYLWD